MFSTTTSNNTMRQPVPMERCWRIEPKYQFAKRASTSPKNAYLRLGRRYLILIQKLNAVSCLGELSAEPFGWQGIATSERSLGLCASLYNESEFPANIKQIRKVTSNDKRKIASAICLVSFVSKRLHIFLLVFWRIMTIPNLRFLPLITDVMTKVKFGNASIDRYATLLT